MGDIFVITNIYCSCCSVVVVICLLLFLLFVVWGPVQGHDLDLGSDQGHVDRRRERDVALW